MQGFLFSELEGASRCKIGFENIGKVMGVWYFRVSWCGNVHFVLVFTYMSVSRLLEL